MKRFHLAVIGAIVLAASMLAVYAEEHPRAEHPRAEHPKAKAAMTQAVYVCPDCHMMAMEAGKCTGCQKDLKEMHLLGVKDGQAMLCACGAGCKCDAAGVKDGKCACGKEVVTMSAKGMYACPMGCPKLSDKPGKCACGMEMKKLE